MKLTWQPTSDTSVDMQHDEGCSRQQTHGSETCSYYHVHFHTRSTCKHSTMGTHQQRAPLRARHHARLQAQAALAGAVVALAASPGEDLLLVALASARLLSLDIGRLDALQVV